MQQIMPNVVFSVSNVKANMNEEIKTFLRFDLNSIYQTTDDVTSVVPFSMLYKKCKQAWNFKDMVIEHLEKPFKAEHQFYSRILQQLSNTQTFFLECQKKLEAVARQEDELKKLVYEQRYTDLYTKSMQAVTFDCQVITKPTKITPDKKRDRDETAKKLVKECNDVVLELEHDVNLHNKCKLALQQTVNKVLVHNKKIGFQSLLTGITYCNFAESAVRFMTALMTQVAYTRKEYLALYDDKRLASDFEVVNMSNLHNDVLLLLAISTKQLAHVSGRWDKVKRITQAFAAIIKELELCNQTMQEEYN